MGLLLALIDLPDFATPLRRIADSARRWQALKPRVLRHVQRADSEQSDRTRRVRGSRSCSRLIFCSVFTILPDYLFRRFVQGKRLGQEITLFSVWYELRWGITLCLILTTLLITMIFYFHPSTTSATSLFRARADPSRDQRPRERDLCRCQWRHRRRDSRSSASTAPSRRPLSRLLGAGSQKSRQKLVMAEADIAAAEGKGSAGSERAETVCGRASDEA